jgi:diguanylate cyclase (GGDEF)-like protein
VAEKVQELETRLQSLLRQTRSQSLVDALNELAWEIRNSDARRALLLSQQAAEISQSLSYRRGLAASLSHLGAFHQLQANNQTALSKCFEALRIFEELQDEQGLAATLNTVGNVYHSLGDYSNALKTHLRSLRMKENIEDLKGQAQSLNNIGTVYHRLNDTARAMEYFLKSLKIDEEVGDRSGEVAALNNIGLVFQEMGEYEKALEFYSRSLDQRDANTIKHAVLLMNIGNVYMKLGNYATAMNYHEQSLKIKRAIGDREGQAESLINIGELCEGMNNPESAMHHYMECLKLSREISDRYVEASTLLDLGGLGLKQKSPARAREHLELALDLARSIDSEDIACRAHQLLARAFEEEGSWEQALQHYKLFHEKRQHAITEDTQRKTRALMVQFEVETALKEKEIYRLKNVELVELNNDLKALTASLQELNNEKTRLLEELRHQAALLEQQAKVDSLTGLWNRRHVDVELENEFNRARRFGHPLTVVMIDIDHFKSINDRYSHLLGDEVLRTVSQIIRKTCRTIDVVSRYGGEEFLLYLPETPADRGLIACEKIRKAVEEYPWAELDAGLRVTISLGLTGDLSVSSYEKMISQADERLYEAKNAGRNRTA